MHLTPLRAVIRRSAYTLIGSVMETSWKDGHSFYQNEVMDSRWIGLSYGECYAGPSNDTSSGMFCLLTAASSSDSIQAWISTRNVRSLDNLGVLGLYLGLCRP